MSILPSPIEIFGTYDRGVPNQERIVLRVNEPLLLSPYFVFLGIKAPLNLDRVIPIPDQFLWLGETNVQVPGWVFIYTGSGQPTISQESNTKDPIHCLYWNKTSVVFTSDEIVPALAQIGWVELGNKPNKSLADLNRPKPPGEINWAELLAYKAPPPPPK